MAKSTRGLMIAAAAASLFLAGCATQGTDNGSVTTAPVATATVPADAGAAKNMASCKGLSSCKHHHHKALKAKHKKVHHKVVKKAAAQTTESTTTTGDATSSK